MAKFTMVGTFGLPCSGKGSVLAAIRHAMKRTSSIISTSAEVSDLMTPQIKEQMRGGALFPLEDVLRQRIKARIEEFKSQGKEVIFLDGFPRFDQQVQWLVDNFMQNVEVNMLFLKVDPGSLENVASRAKARARDEFDTDPALLMGRIDKQAAMITGVEQAIYRHGLPYYTVVNSSSPAEAAEQFMRQVPPPQ